MFYNKISNRNVLVDRRLGFWRQSWRFQICDQQRARRSKRETTKHSSRVKPVLWATVSGIPIHYRKLETYQSVGQALGVYDTADVEGGRVRVSINGDLPLKFECKVGFDNGDVVKVTIKYEDLHRYCFTCKRISHEEGTCPGLTEKQRDVNRLIRLEEKEREERATREVFSIPHRNNAGDHNMFLNRDYRGKDLRKEGQTNNVSWSERRSEQEYSHDLRKKLTERREVYTKNVWNRLDSNTHSELPRDRERYHPYHHSSRVESRGKYRDTAPSLEWRRKDHQDMSQDMSKNYTSRSENLGGKHWERSEKYLPTRRSPTDSQRTISDHFPMNRARETEEICDTQRPGKEAGRNSSPMEQSKTESSTALKAQRKADVATKDQETRGQSEVEKEKEQATSQSKVPEIASHELRNNSEKETMESSERRKKDKDREDKEKEDADIERSIDEYAEMAMNEEMIDADDLLDENFENDELLVEEGREEEEQIEAIAQLSQNRSTRALVGEKMRAKPTQQAKEAVKEPVINDQTDKNGKTNLMPLGKREVQRALTAREPLRLGSLPTEADYPPRRSSSNQAVIRSSRSEGLKNSLVLRCILLR
ncbi:hypothetical protein F2Q69_00009097 [Brassica cretica]|uniref:Zinc knuckle CX2CX4HX4C domain-containing protein n=1 Tax=Brassica cretica TaxID=69181 RepID=A0A8S9PIR8_BRACR|nr:hypothetical protein F2Q69_00009097 [Brassica cretica]